MVIIRSLTLPFDHSDAELKEKVIGRLGIPAGDLVSIQIIKRSLDARRGRPIQKVYSLLVGVKDEEHLKNLTERSPDLAFNKDDAYQSPKKVLDLPAGRPLVVGTGPAGLFAGLILAEAGLGPILLDRGKSVKERTRDVAQFWKEGELNPDSNVQFGEGGAGTFSDGKLRTRVKDRKNRTRKILEELVRAGAPDEIIYEHKPHVGTANLVRVVKNLRKRIENLGGEYHFEAKVTKLILEEGKIKGLLTELGQEFLSEIVILAIGHSARDTFQMLDGCGVQMAPKAFSIGFRIEHLQEMIDRRQYGKNAGHPALGAAEYQLARKTSSGRSVYSFCMCPGGSVIASSSEPGTVVTNGMSQYSRNLLNANAAIVAEVSPGDFSGGALAGFLFQRTWEEKAFLLGGRDFTAPIQLAADFVSGTTSQGIRSVVPSYQPGVKLANLREVVPEGIADAISEGLVYFDQLIPGFCTGDAVLTGVETRTSSPLRILRKDNFQSISVEGLYPIGEGSGYAGGIMSSALDGIKAAEQIIRKLNEER